MNVALRRPMTREEFLLWVEGQEGRYEFDGVRPVAMVGGSNDHGTISVNILSSLRVRLRGTSCRTMSSEGGGVATADNAVRYPDAVVTCSLVDGKARLLPEPVVVFEVLSPTSLREDLVEKPAEYGAVPSIKRYVIVEQERAEVRGYVLTTDGGWAKMAPLGEGAVLTLPEIGIVLPLVEIYEDVAFGVG